MVGSGGAPRRAAPGSHTRRLPRRRRRTVLAAGLWTALALVVFLGSTAAGLLAAPVDFTPPAQPRPALLLDRNNKIIGEIAGPDAQVEVTAAQIPDVLRNAVVSAEDKSFYSNAGIDPVSIVRAAINDLRGGDTQGGSTITQQYVKDVFVGSQRTLLRKLREASLAIRLDQRLPKSEILTRYLNEVYFGEGTYGVQAASEYYYGIPASQLSLAQASMLAGVIPAPSDYNPATSLTKARVRQQYVLNRMVDDGYISAATASAAFATPPAIVRHTATAMATSIAPQFVRTVMATVKAKYAKDQDEVYESGMAVHTTLDSSWQQAATTALGTVLKQPSDPEAAVVVMDSDTGQVLGIADKVDAATAQYDLATLANRSSGSTIKPFTLATALETGHYTLDTGVYGPSTKSYPVSQCSATDGQPYTVRNDEGGGGYYTLQSALAKSVNTVYGPLAITLGTTKVAAVARAAGMTSPAGAVNTNCAMGLGVYVSPLNEAVGYSTLADGGVHHPASYIASISEGVGATGTGGRTVYTAPHPATRAIPADVDAEVQTAMRAVVRYGTATAAQQPDGLDVFGKTGTNDDFKDAWFSGCVPAYHVCVTTWMGYDDNRSLTDVEGVHHVAGGTLPAEVFAQTMDGYRSLAHPVVTAPSGATEPTPIFSASSPPSVPPLTPVSSSASTPATTPTRSRTVTPPASSSAPVSPSSPVSITPTGASTSPP